MNWNWKSKHNLYLGVGLICAAVLLLLDGLGIRLGGAFSFWRLALCGLCIAWLVDRIVSKNYAEIFFPMAFLLMLVQSPLLELLGRPEQKLISEWTLLLCALLLTIGFSLLLPGQNGGKKLEKMGSATLYLDAADLSQAEISEHMGTVHVYLTNLEAYPGGGVVRIHNNMGSITLHLPESWQVLVHAKDNLGSVNVPPQTQTIWTSNITLDVSDNMGAVNVSFSK